MTTIDLYITLDNKELHGAGSFSDSEQRLFSSALPEINTSQGTYLLERDISRVVSSDEARKITHWGKWETPRELPVRFLTYRKVDGAKH